MDDIPPVDRQPERQISGEKQTNITFEGFEVRTMDADARYRENINRASDQRYNLRIWAVVIASFAVFLFIFLLFWIALQLPKISESEVDSSFLIALYVAPIGAISTLSISLLLAAFRGSKDSDDDHVASSALNGARSMMGMS